MYRYILIEDEPIIRKGTIKKLEPLSSLISCCGEAANGEEGLDLIKRTNPDFVITDMQMPVMGGMELLPYLAENYPELPLIVISGYKNFDYMKQAIHANAVDYILKPFSAEDIQKTVRSVIEYLQNMQQSEEDLNALQEENELAYQNLDLRSLENSIMGNGGGAPSIKSEKFQYIRQAQSFRLFAIYQDQTREAEQEVSALQNWLERNGLKDTVLCIPCPSSGQLSFVLLFSDADPQKQKETLDLLLALLLKYKEREQAGRRISISTEHSDLAELHIAYREAAEAFDTQAITDEQNLCYFHKTDRHPIRIEWESEAEFLFRVEAGMEKEVQKLYQQLFEYYRSIEGCSLQDIKIHCGHLGARCQDILNYYLNDQNGQPAPVQNSSSMESIVSSLFSVGDVRDYYGQFFLNVTNMLREKSVYVQNELIDQIKIYIERNYMENLTEEFIASLFYLNRSYLSQLFYKKTGKKFIDYLTDIRIEKSKELLKNTDLQMYNIARAVGYENSKYFFRIFRKKTGLTPMQYRLSP